MPILMTRTRLRDRVDRAPAGFEQLGIAPKPCGWRDVAGPELPLRRVLRLWHRPSQSQASQLESPPAFAQSRGGSRHRGEPLTRSVRLGQVGVFSPRPCPEGELPRL